MTWCSPNHIEDAECAVSAGAPATRPLGAPSSDEVKKKSARGRKLSLDDVRAIVLSMPDVEETTAYGMSAFKAGKKRFAGQPVERPDIEPNTLGVGLSFEERDARIAARPDAYYLTPHFAPYPAVLVRLGRIRRDELRELLAAAWHYAMDGSATARRPVNATRRRVRRV